MSAENAEVRGPRGTASFDTELWVPIGTTVTFGAQLGRHQGPKRFIVLDTYTTPTTTVCSAT